MTKAYTDQAAILLIISIILIINCCKLVIKLNNLFHHKLQFVTTVSVIILEQTANTFYKEGFR